MKEKIAVLVVCPNMSLGGIQSYVYNTARWLNERGLGLIVAFSNRYKINHSYYKLLNSKPNELIRYEYLKREFHSIIKNEHINHATIITFYMHDYALAEDLRLKNLQIKIDTFYYVPNFKGPYYYLEETFSGRKYENVRCRMSEIVRKMDKADAIRYFSPSHIEKMTSQYGYSPRLFKEVGIPLNEKRYNFDEEKRREVYKREEKEILTVSRFDFPHKGFIIGLIRDFKYLKEKYPQLTLKFVGSGAGLTLMKQEIANLPNDVQTSIVIEPAVPFDVLPKYYSEAYINVSVAGCCRLGAKQGTLSMPARHFTYSCEVYGFYPKSRDKTTSDEPGESLEKYISLALSMTEEEYVNACRSSYDSFNNPIRDASFFDTNNTTGSILSKKDIRYIYRTVRWIKILIPRKREWEAIKNEGLFKPIKRRLKRVLLHKRV